MEIQAYICTASGTIAGGGAGSLRITHTPDPGTQYIPNTES